jgi:hypothetical protein
MSAKLLPERKDFLTLPKGVEVTKTGLKISAPLSYVEWESLGSHLQAVHRSVLFWIGDWLVWGQGKWGEKYAQAVESTGYAVQTLMNAQWVASRIEISLRGEVLSWSHHREIAALEPPEQGVWLKAAVDNQWTVRELRDEIKKKRIQRQPHRQKKTASKAFPETRSTTLSAKPKT